MLLEAIILLFATNAIVSKNYIMIGKHYPMTLVLTEISRLGIAMAADSAVTETLKAPDGNTVYRVLTGVHKLQVIDKLSCGISVWGDGQIGRVSTDIWLKSFIDDQEPNYDSIQEFAVLLQDELRRDVPRIDVRESPLGTLGFHLAGYVNYEGKRMPTFYHIHNGRSESMQSRGIEIDPAKVNANNDFPPDAVQKMMSRGLAILVRNGDFQIYAALFKHLDSFLRELSESGDLRVPDSRNLMDRAEWLRFQIRTISELYRLSDRHLPSIGGEIGIITISPSGVDRCGLTI
jgi:hypothetical protein